MEHRKELLRSTKEIVEALGDKVIDKKAVGPQLDFVTYLKWETGEICIAAIRPEGLNIIPLSQLLNP